ncbi:MAG TPA: D-glycerate dehydrogenase [bacterium (Candidatus Stahlbacteria)]|nr:D-glycerate dehydrogenase [Candidatus Stahlbacteria bacterium]
MKVLLTAPIVGWEELKGELEPIVLEFPSKEEVIEKLKGCIGLIAHLSFPVDRLVIDAGSDLRVIANYAVGYDNIDISYASRRGIYVLNTPDVLTRATAELTWALVFTVARRICEGDRMVRASGFSGWKPDLLLGMELKGKRMGVIGLGRIGSEVARIGMAIGVEVYYYDEIKKEGFRFLPLDELLESCDIITLHLPLTQKTRHILDREKLLMIRPGSILVNTGRGGLIDEKVLVEILKEGRIRAGLDVYEFEPSVPDELKDLDNVVILPHIGSATKRARSLMARLCFDGIRKVLKGGVPDNLVNREILT